MYSLTPLETESMLMSVFSTVAFSLYILLLRSLLYVGGNPLNYSQIFWSSRRNNLNAIIWLIHFIHIIPEDKLLLEDFVNSCTSTGLEWMAGEEFRRKGPLDLVDRKLIVNHQGVLVAKKATSLLGRIRQSTASRMMGVILSVCSGQAGRFCIWWPTTEKNTVMGDLLQKNISSHTLLSTKEVNRTRT